MQCFSITKTEILDQENVSLLYKIYCIPKKNMQYRHQYTSHRRTITASFWNAKFKAATERY